MDLSGWHLHNAGNDAAYTMEAMIAICFKDAESWTKGKTETDEENARRTQQKIQAAKEIAEEQIRADAEGWSGDEKDDGGVAIGGAQKYAHAGLKTIGGMGQAHVVPGHSSIDKSGPMTFVQRIQAQKAAATKEDELAEGMDGVSLN